MPPPPPPPRVLPAPASDGTLSLAMASLASDETDEALAPELARLEIVSVMGEGEGEEAQLASQGADTATAPAYGVLSDAESEASLKRYKSSSTLVGMDWLN